MRRGRSRLHRSLQRREMPGGDLVGELLQRGRAQFAMAEAVGAGVGAVLAVCSQHVNRNTVRHQCLDDRQDELRPGEKLVSAIHLQCLIIAGGGTCSHRTASIFRCFVGPSPSDIP